MLFTHCQKRDFGAKNRSVLSKILIGFPRNPLELGEIGGDSRTRIFTVFSMQRGAKSLENTAFSGFSHLPLSSVKFRQVRFLTLDSKSVVPSLVPWVRIPPSPPKMRLRPRKKPQGNFLRLLLFGGYFVGFIKSYKHLDNLCKDINGIGITGYINDMEDRPSAEYHIAG